MVTKRKSQKALNSKNIVVDKPDVKSKTPSGRPARFPLTDRFKRSIPAVIREEGYVYRFIRDTTERIEGFESAWWEGVKDGAGRQIKKASGSGGYLLLYRVEQKYFDEDLAIKRKKPINLLTENAKLAAGDKYSSEYVPEGHNSVVTINN